MILSILAAILSILITLIIFVYLKQMYQRIIVCRKIPGPPIVPIVGNALHFTKNPTSILPAFLQLFKKYGQTIQVWFVTKQLIVTTDTGIVEKLLSSSKYIKRYDELYTYVKPWLGNGLATNNDDELWQKRRKVLTPAFHFTILERSLTVFHSAIDSFINNLDKHLDGPAFDIYPYGSYYILDVLCESAMGVKIDVQTNTSLSYAQAVENILALIFNRFFSIMGHIDFVYNYFSHYTKKYNQCLDVLHGTGNKVIEERRSLKMVDKNTNRKRQAFLDTLLDCTIDGRPLSDLEIREEVDTFMFSGYETFSKATGFLLYALANNPDVQTRLFDEISTELDMENESKPLTMFELNKLKYLDAVIKETLRMYPPVPFLPRALQEDFEHGNLTIPANKGIVIFIHGVHHDENNFAEPHRFKPERFLDENSAQYTFKFIPFGAGPRNCIGQKYVLCGLKFLAVKILQRYELLSGGPEHELKLAPLALLSALNGVNIRIRLRAVNK